MENQLPWRIFQFAQLCLSCQPTSEVFPVLLQYCLLYPLCTDMGSLTFQVGLGHMTDNSMVIGQAVVPSLKQLTPNSSLKG